MWNPFPFFVPCLPWPTMLVQRLTDLGIKDIKNSFRALKKNCCTICVPASHSILLAIWRAGVSCDWCRDLASDFAHTAATAGILVLPIPQLLPGLWLKLLLGKPLSCSFRYCGVPSIRVDFVSGHEAIWLCIMQYIGPFHVMLHKQDVDTCNTLHPIGGRRRTLAPKEPPQDRIVVAP